MHLLHNSRLAFPTADDLHPELAQYLRYLNISNRVQRDYNWNLTEDEISARMSSSDFDYLCEFDNYLTHHRHNVGGGCVFTSPWLSKDYCKTLVHEIQCIKESSSVRFEPNPDEELPFQIPEVVLHEKCKPLFDGVVQLLKAGMFPVLRHLYQCTPNDIASLQLTNYAPQGTQHGNWHHDVSSDYTIVCALNTGDYVGGGTEFKDGFALPVRIAPLPVGHVVIFPGKHVMHRGLHVESGERLLLTCWLKRDDELEDYDDRHQN